MSDSWAAQGPGDGGSTVVAVFNNQADAEQAIQDLKDAGFSREGIGVVLRDPAYGHEPKVSVERPPLPSEAASAGAASGGILGGVVGLLAGVGALALPGVGPVIAGGALVAALTGAGLGAAAGGVLGTLIGLGVPEGSARYFEDGLRRGGVLVVVDAGGRGEAARDILRFSRGDLGTGTCTVELEEQEAADEAWRGAERRYHDDPAYHGPERRLSHR